ncbi:hypothetical protein CVU82_03590 [Candidatus Falkowbacteria bacterium HGW-Falkowbacteria-1]|uniref:FAD-binding FR-type domain-containing protein n=1 Tax=Candidatus Falkowbacteria bacterium HGW-Falkowbacteria-1 TaxID=2013768 RepID=A0A2N2E8S1_9BACT|nr:MAG: hypothetical protein CVU82_03590 [Candidatus Falkowbacteria bacterium HGW-Falkowbacteria-1]
MKKPLLYLSFFVSFFLIFVFWWLGSGNVFLNNPSIGIIYVVLGRITGLLAVYFILLQFLFIGRVKWLERVFGFDKLSVAHHWSGIIAFVFIVAHLVFLFLGYGILNELSLWQQFRDFNLNWEGLFPATVSVVLFILVVISSISIAKKKLKYEIWYYVHLMSYLAIILAYGHQLELGHDLRASNLFAFFWVLLYLFVGANFIFYRFVWQLYSFYKFRFYISEIKSETEDTISLYIKGTSIEGFKYMAGQFIMLRFLNKSMAWQAHPFSISSEPNQDYIRITIKNLGDFSSKMKNLVIGTKVLIDGPIGVFTKKEKQSEKILFIAGGVGITPVRPLIGDFLKDDKDVVLLYSAKNREQIIFKEELEGLMNKNAERFKMYYIIRGDNDCKFGEITKESMESLVPDIAQRDVYICGSYKKSVIIKKYLVSLKVNKKRIYYEKFSI